MTGSPASVAAAGQGASRSQRRAAAAVTGAATGCVIALEWPAPFRPGLLSVLLYVSPLIVALSAIRRMRKAGTAPGISRVLGGTLAVMAGVFVLALPFGYLQRAAAPAVWLAGSGIPLRAWPQVITVPGMTQEPYRWDAGASRLTAHFDAPVGPGEFWAAIETVRSGTANPCSTLDYPDGDTTRPEPARCVRARPELWMLTTRDGTASGFARRVDGVTITLTGSSKDQARLRYAILAAHPGSDAELWSRIDSLPARATLIFL